MDETIQRLYKKAEVAEILAISMGKLNSMIANEEIDYVVLSDGPKRKRIRFTKESVEAFISKRSTVNKKTEI